MDSDCFRALVRHLIAGAVGRVKAGSVLAIVLVMASVPNAAGQEAAGQDSDNAFELFVAMIDDTTCGDGIGRTYRTATMLSAAQKGNDADFLNSHEACVGVSGRAAEAGLPLFPVRLSGQCADAIALPGWNYEWVICDLAFFPEGDLLSPVRIELEQFHILTHDEKKFAPYTDPDLYAGQMRDISGGVDLVGPDPVFGTVAFPVNPGDIDGPFLLGWPSTGNFLVADELEPEVGEHFIRDMQSL
jgi:hypothetical protein